MITRRDPKTGEITVTAKEFTVHVTEAGLAAKVGRPLSNWIRQKCNAPSVLEEKRERLRGPNVVPGKVE